MGFAWPVTGGTTSQIVLSGDVSQSRWGTDGLLPTLDAQAGNVDGLTLLSILTCNQAQDISEEHYKQGSGAKVGRSLIVHGGTWELTVRDRRDVTFPQVGQTVTVVDMANHFGYGIGAQVTAFVKAAPYKASSGVPGERDLTLEKITLIDQGQ